MAKMIRMYWNALDRFLDRVPCAQQFDEDISIVHTWDNDDQDHPFNSYGMDYLNYSESIIEAQSPVKMCRTPRPVNFPTFRIESTDTAATVRRSNLSLPVRQNPLQRQEIFYDDDNESNDDITIIEHEENDYDASTSKENRCSLDIHPMKPLNDGTKSHQEPLFQVVKDLSSIVEGSLAAPSALPQYRKRLSGRQKPASILGRVPPQYKQQDERLLQGRPLVRVTRALGAF